MTMLPILYSFRRCPYAMRARLALAYSGTATQLREVRLATKPAAMLAASPKGTVPVLVLPDGTVIDESIDIMRWALAHNDPEGWLDRDDAALVAANDGPFKHHLDRYKYAGRYGADPLEHRRAALDILGELEARLGKGGQLCGSKRGLADFAIMPFVRQFSAVAPDWFGAQALPHLQKWLAAHLASPLFETVMVRLAPWAPGDAAVVFPPEDVGTRL